MVEKQNGELEKTGDIPNANVGSNTVVGSNKYSQTYSDGTTLNNSSKLQETKKLDSFEFSNFQLSKNDNGTVLLGTIKNTSSTSQGNILIDISFKDEKGNTIHTIEKYYIGIISAGASTQLNASSTADFVDSYDFTITKSK